MPTVTCLILLKSHGYKSLNASRATWLKKCDDYLIIKPNKTKNSKYVYNEDTGSCLRNDFGEVVLTSDNSWSILCHALHLLKRPTDWVLIVPDTSLVVVENLKEYARNYDWRRAWYMGHPIEHYSANYNVGSAGILLSNGSVEALFKIFTNPKTCQRDGKHWNKEDLHLGM